MKSICFKRASNRWSTLLTKTKSRIGHKYGMRKRLGEANWAAFAKYVEAEYKTAFMRAFTPILRILCCSGKLNGGSCPKKLDLKRIAKRNPRIRHKLGCFTVQEEVVISLRL